jgi:hypothetical protein
MYSIELLKRSLTQLDFLFYNFSVIFMHFRSSAGILCLNPGKFLIPFSPSTYQVPTNAEQGTGAVTSKKQGPAQCGGGEGWRRGRGGESDLLALVFFFDPVCQSFVLP